MRRMDLTSTLTIHLNKAEILLHDINTKDSGVLYHFYTIIRSSLEKFLLSELCSAKM